MWFQDVLRRIYPRIGLDLGSRVTRLRVLGEEELVLEEPTCLALDTKRERVLAVGEEAAEMEGRVGEHIEVIWPLQGGVVQDEDIVEALVRAFLQEIFNKPTFMRPIVMVTVPIGMAPVERDSLVEALYAVGAREVYSIAQPLAAAIGAGVPIAEATGSFVLQLGAGSVEAAIISLSSCVAEGSTRQAGEVVDRSLQEAIAEEYQIRISREQARELKQAVTVFVGGSETAAAAGGSEGRLFALTGQDVQRSEPRTAQVAEGFVRGVIEPFLEEYVQVCRTALRDAAPELIVDIVDKGMLLSGGGAQWRGLDRALTRQLELPVSVVEDPEQAAIEGVMTVLEHLELFKESVGYD